MIPVPGALPQDEAQHLGTPAADDDELPPVIGEDYRHTARRMFERAFFAVE